MTCLLGLSMLSCDKVKEDLDILIKADDLIRYSVMVQVNEATGEIPEDLSISVVGEDADYVYDIAGNKELAISGGLITLGVHPKHEPVEGDPVRFSVKISGPDYVSMIVPVRIDKNQFSQIKELKIVNASTPPPTVAVAKEEAALASDGTPAEPITVSSPTNAVTNEVTSVTVPASTQFLNAAGTPVVGSSVSMSVVNYNTKSSETATLFPGGKLNATNVKGPENKNISAFFMPAGFASINFDVNGTAIKKFSQPINVAIEIDPQYKLLASNTTIKEGDKIAIWSYSEDTGDWQYEKEGTVSTANGKLLVPFTTDHLTVYSIAEYVETTDCTSPTAVFSASWLKQDTQPMTLEIWNEDLSKKLSSETIVVSDGLEVVLNDLPAFAVRYKVLSQGAEIASGSIADPCSGGQVNIILPAPAVPLVGITLSLTVKCPDKGTVIPPDFYLYYKNAGAPDTEYKLLGIVKQGKLSTTLLEVGKRYDFKAIYGDRKKFIGNHLIDKTDMSTTVGVNDNLGSVVPDQNRAILIEECSKL